MDIGELREHLESLSLSLQDDQKEMLDARLRGLSSAYPFSEYEYIIMVLLDRNVISFDEYEQLRGDYVCANKYLELFGLAPRVFGEIWAHQHIIDLDGRFARPSKDIDPEFEGEYDLFLGETKVEVKACRAINTRKRGALVTKALKHGSSEPFWMNYQQLKPEACDVFIFIGVWVDRIVYWVLSNDEVKTNRYISHQHRGGIEYQIGITDKNICEFDAYRVAGPELGRAVIRKRS